MCSHEEEEEAEEQAALQEQAAQALQEEEAEEQAALQEQAAQALLFIAVSISLTHVSSGYPIFTSHPRVLGLPHLLRSGYRTPSCETWGSFNASCLKLFWCGRKTGICYGYLSSKVE